MTPARVLIFCRDIYAVERMDSLLHHNRLPSEVMHSGLDQRVREKILYVSALSSIYCPLT